MTRVGDAERWKKEVEWEEKPAEDAAKADDGCEKAEHNLSAGDIVRTTGPLDLLDDDCAIKQTFVNFFLCVWKMKAKIITSFLGEMEEEGAKASEADLANIARLHRGYL